MRNLKKILAMVLALIMSLSLMATAGATDFSDADQIGEDYEVAVEVLNGLGVFKGYDDGARFEPQGKITRAEVAAIIYRIATGDVADTQKDIYSTWGMFKQDVSDSNWFAGYVNYCANAGYIKGRSADVFDPNAEVTGYEALAMILRAVGYDKLGEFTGSNWQVNTASVARERGILKNISSGQLGQAATREMIAEILFRAILINKVDYTPAYGYQEGTTSVGYDSLGLEDLAGVVEANEYADLYGTSPMKDGQTRLNVNGTKYVLDTGSVLTDIGEIRHAYVTDKGAKVLYGLYDAEDYTVAEPANFGGEGDTVNDVARSANLRLTADTEYFVNFGDPIDKYTSDYRIEYKIGLGYTEYQIMELLYRNGGTAQAKNGTPVGDPVKGVDQDAWDKFVSTYNRDADVVGEYTYDKVIRVEEEITAQDMFFIREIFYGSDSLHGLFDENYDIYFGEVYVATKSQVDNAGNSVDISDDISYIEFLDKYINDEFKDFSASDNGEWLKIVDYDNDGNADYVMRTDFVMTTTTDHNTKSDIWFVEYLDYETGLPTEIDAADISSKTELAMPTEENMKLVAAKDLVEGQVYMYTYIDGVYYITEPAVVATSASKINYRLGTVDCADGATREWSGIDKKAIQYYTEIDEVSLNVNYTMYLDQFGYIRLFTEADKGFVLLTDGYFETDRRADAYKAEIWADGKTSDIDVTHTNAAPATTFIWNNADRDDNQNYHDDEGTWQRLKEFGHVYYGAAKSEYYGHWVDTQAGLTGIQVRDPYLTNIAAYVENNGKYTLSTVDAADTSRARYEAYAIDNTDLINGAGAGTVYSNDRTLYGITAWNSDGTVDDSKNVRIQTTTDTLYYYLQNNGEIVSWNGYNGANAPERFQVNKAYAVGSYVPDRDTGTNDNTLPYLVAEIVVIEGRFAPTVLNADFLYAMVDGGIRDHYLLGKSGDGYGEKVGKTKNTAYNGLINFYDQAGNLITGDYEDYGVYAGRVVTYDRVKGRNYVQLSINKSELTGKRTTNLNYGEPAFSFYTDEVPLYNLTENTAYANNTLRNFTTRDGSNIAIGDYIIYMVDSNNNVGLVINVSESKTTEKNSIAKLDALWNAISADQIRRYNVLPFAFYGVNKPDLNPVAQTTLNASSAAAVSGKTYMGSVTVTYDQAVAAGNNHWIAPNAVNYTMIATAADTNFGATVGYPGVPEPTKGMAYIVVIGNNWWLLRQESQTATTWNLKSSSLDVLVDNTNSAAPAVTVFNPIMTLRQLAGYLSSDKGTVTVKMNAKGSDIYLTNTDTQLININTSSYDVGIYVGGTCVASTPSKLTWTSVSGYNTISWNPAEVTGVKFGTTTMTNGQYFKTSDYSGKDVYVTLRDTANYKVTNTNADGTRATYDAVNGVWYFTPAAGNVVITVGRYTEQDRVAAVAAAYTNITEKNYIVGNNFYNVSADAVSIAALKGAIEDAVAAQAQREIAALGFTGVTVRATLTGNPTMQAPGTAVYSAGNATLTLILNGATTTVSATGINASIAYADLRATQSAIEAAFNSQTISTGNVSTATDLLTAAGNTVPGVTMQYVKITNIANNMVQFVYRFTYGGTDSGEITGVHAVTNP